MKTPRSKLRGIERKIPLNLLEASFGEFHPKRLKQNLASPSWNLVPGSRCLLGKSLDTCEKEDFPPISIPLCTFFENDPDPTPSTENGFPVITEVNFPSTIIGDGQDVYGTVKFTDNNAGVNWAQFDVLEDTCGGCFTPFSFDPVVSELTEGEFEFSMWCTTDEGFSWTMRLTLRDVAGHVSEPVDFSVECKPPQTPPIARILYTEFETEEENLGGNGH